MEMSKGRVEAFSDGVLAIIITIMVLEMKVPHGGELATLQPLIPVFLSYALSFVYVGIYWNNHHHLLHATRHVNGRIMWANLHLLFWLSLIPFATAWMGENHFDPWPVALYGAILLIASCSYVILTRTLVTAHGKESALARSIGSDRKGKISIAVYAAAIPLSLLHAGIASALYVLVAVMWLAPDRRIEKGLQE
jgi:uncharacterized membrane protein